MSVLSTDSTASTSSSETGASVTSSDTVVLSLNSSANATVLTANIESSILAANATEVTFCAILCIMRVSFLYSERISVKLWRGSTQKSSLHDYFCFRTFPFYAVRTFSQLGKTYFFIAKKKCQLRNGKRHFIQIFWLHFGRYAQGRIYEFRRRFL